MKVIFIGDIVGKPARGYIKDLIPRIKEEVKPDLIIANAENAAGGSSITPGTAGEIFDAGIDILTTGDHVFKKKESRDVLRSMDVIRPLNYGEEAAGKGFLIKEVSGEKVAVINLLGRVFMQPIDCPFKAVRKVLEDIKKEAKIIIVDIHAEATSEKLAMGYFLGGKVSAVLGTHTHIPTADERLINHYTAYITDTGMSGSCDSILGRERSQIIERFLTNMPTRFNLAQADIRVQGVLIDIDASTGAALGIKRIEYRKDDND
ncbi:MAG: TIGR00282 family metallophosphoesterase [Candidatus Omnitrophica bacterium]|nr:TIGR00282 family metallophosphoesterase [Candidatus Omnitrophota bacterium]MBD3268691.1 TIGR00282 family metallophosphoesterase [Candidatus Omnitrophota bacterium]